MKALIIEDDKKITEIISLSLKIRWPELKVSSAEHGEEGIQMAEREAPDIIILDLGLPDISGFEVLKAIRLFSTVPIMIVSALGEEDSVVRGLELGADEYVIKPFRQMELLSRVKALTRRTQEAEAIPPVVAGRLRLDPSLNKLTMGSKEIKLTRTEGLILYCLMRNQDKVVSYGKLHDAVWGGEYPGSAEALRVHVRRLREKLERDSSNPELIQTNIGVGYCFSLSKKNKQH
jgi:two-component system response regulator VicR